jgi:hypothetical protein
MIHFVQPHEVMGGDFSMPLPTDGLSAEVQFLLLLLHAFRHLNIFVFLAALAGGSCTRLLFLLLARRQASLLLHNHPLMKLSNPWWKFCKLTCPV